MDEGGSALQHQHETLLLMARKTIVYISLSAAMNLFIHLPLLRVIPYVSFFVMVYSLFFALAR
jgi:Zn-dependent membrane protease YugP